MELPKGINDKNSKDYTKIIHGNSSNVLERLCEKSNERNKYSLILTSPPYYKQRNYGKSSNEIGQEKTPNDYIDKLVDIFSNCKNLLKNDGSLFIVIGDKRVNNQKLLLPHKLAMKLINIGYFFHEDIIWNKKNPLPSGSTKTLSQNYEYILFLSKCKNPLVDINAIRVKSNNINNSDKIKKYEFQYIARNKNHDMINQIKEKISNSTQETAINNLPSTTEIALAYGYDPEKYCPRCHRTFKRHATRKRFGDHKHYPIFAVCNPRGKNPGNVWDISTKSHRGNEHFAIFPEELVSRIIKFTTKKDDYILDPFVGRGTTGIVSSLLERKFVGIDLYLNNVQTSRNNIK